MRLAKNQQDTTIIRFHFLKIEGQNLKRSKVKKGLEGYLEIVLTMRFPSESLSMVSSSLRGSSGNLFTEI